MAFFDCLGYSSIEPDTIDVTFTVYGAKEDNIAITSVDGDTLGNVIFGADKTESSITLTIPKEGMEIILTSSVANYVEQVFVDKDTTSVKVMPDGALYWYGNEVLPFSTDFKSNSGYTLVACNKETNQVSTSITGASRVSGFGVSELLSAEFYAQYTNINCRAKYNSTDWEIKTAPIGKYGTITQPQYIAALTFRDGVGNPRCAVITSPNKTNMSSDASSYLNIYEVNVNANISSYLSALWLE